MKIQIEGNLYLESDEMQFMLKEYSVTKTGENAGKEVSSTLGYYSSLSGAIKALIRMKLHESTAKSLRELREDWELLTNWAESLFQDKTA